MSFKDATLKDITFEDCVFIGCYFRRTTISGCRFPASRFIDCELVKPQIFDCSFAYARFTGSPVEYDYITAAISGDTTCAATLPPIWHRKPRRQDAQGTLDSFALMSVPPTRRSFVPATPA